MTTKRALVLITDEIEESEVVITADILRRGGVDVHLAGLMGDKTVVCNQNIRIVPDVGLEKVANDLYDCIVIPGGPGADALSKSKLVGDLLKNHYENQKLIGAICAGTLTLLSHGIGYGKTITSHPWYKEKLGAEYECKNDRVVQDENLITSQGPGTAFDFALKLVDYLKGVEKMKSLIEPMRIEE